MTRRSFFLGIGTALALVGGVGATLVLLIRHEPEVYTQTALPAGPERQQHSGEFQTKFVQQLINGIINSEPKWCMEFSEEQINSYFQEDFIRSGISEKSLPNTMSDPRVRIEEGKLRLAFRYGQGFWSSIITIDMRAWVAGGDPNVVAVEFLSCRAGALPISIQTLLERICETARQQKIDVTWYRHEGNPVAVLRFYSDQPRPATQLQSLELHHGKIVISGCSTEAPPLGVSIPPALPRPSGN